jgi:putative restriction endonuclease
MRAYIGITDRDWFDQLRRLPDPAEVNFWQPGGNRNFGALLPGELFLFKLHSPENFIVGGGVFAHFSLLPVSLAWKSFGACNGARTLEEMRARIEHYRKQPAAPSDDYRIGCIALTQPFFLPREAWIPIPTDFHLNTQVGKRYDLEDSTGAALLERVELALRGTQIGSDLVAVHDRPAMPGERFGKERLVRPRLGQGSFRILVTDAYERRCSLTGERVLPVLEAAHVRPYSRDGAHEIDNGLLLRSDLHALFDNGYITVTPEHRLEISRRIREEFENGKDYYALHGATVRPPARGFRLPSDENLRWHNENMYKG